MKKLVLIFCVLFSLNLDAQYVTSLAKNAATPQDGGVTYFLPRNVIEVEVTIEETCYYMGPYSEYASSLLGLTNYIRENKTELNIVGVNVDTGVEADPNAVYFIAQDEKSKDPVPNIIMNENGIIIALGFDNMAYKDLTKPCRLYANDMMAAYEEEVSFIDVVEMPDNGEDDEEGSANKKRITKDDRANLAAEQIRKFRNAKYEIASGFQEVAYGDATRVMLERLDNMEYEYLCLFKGKTVKRTYNKVFRITPESNQSNATVTLGKLAGGETIKIQFDSKNTTPNVFPLGDDIKKSAQANKIFYRVPASTNVKVSSDNKILADKQLIISQFGEIQLVTIKGNKALFNPNTGELISLER